jgi:ankyrin repeat protein
MKTNVLLLTLALVAAPVLAAEDAAAVLQKALFEEEANRNVAAAMEGYKKVIAEFDEQRKLAATAVFRLGECHRKQGDTNAATAQYQRVVNEFADQPQLADLSRQRLGGSGPSTALEEMRSDGSSEATEIARLEATLKESPDLINAPGEKLLPPLHNAARLGRLQVAEFLLANGAKIEAAAQAGGGKALHFAAEAANKPMIELLLRKGADVNARNGPGLTALHIAARGGFLSVAELLLEKGADINAVDRNGYSPLHSAVSRRFRAFAEFLLARGANVGLASEPEGTPLQMAVRSNDADMLELLIAHKADVNTPNNMGESPLHVAAREGNTEAAMVLVAHGANVNAGTEQKRNWTPLCDAVKYKRPEVVSLLLEKGAKPDLQMDGTRTLLSAAIEHNSPEMVKALLDHKADPNFSAGVPPLALAVSRESLPAKRIALLLLERGANPNVRGPSRMTPLIIATRLGNEDVVARLLSSRANVNAQDEAGNSALHYVLQEGPRLPSVMAIAKLLLAAGVDPNLKNKDGDTPLMMNVESGAATKVQALLREQSAK